MCFLNNESTHRSSEGGQKGKGILPLLLILDALTVGFFLSFLFLRANDVLGDGVNNLRFDSGVGPRC